VLQHAVTRYSEANLAKGMPICQAVLFPHSTDKDPSNMKNKRNSSIGFAIVSSLVLLLGVPVVNANANITMRQVTGTLKDASISTIIYAKYTANPILSPLKIHVSTDHGIVTLNGKVNSNIQYEKAVMIAHSVEGVSQVNADALKVKDSDTPLQDLFTTAQIKGLILKERIFGDVDLKETKIKIETKDGVVYVDGKVNNAKQKEAILKMIKALNDVKGVKSNLRVAS